MRHLPRPHRPRTDRGATSPGGIVSSIVVVIALIVAMRLLIGTDPIEWLDTAADWCVDTIRDIVRAN